MTKAIEEFTWTAARLHLGCGSCYLHGWINADAVDAPPFDDGAGHPDVLIDIHRDLGRIPEGSLHWIYWSHGPEHVYPDQLPEVMSLLHRALARTGALTVATIDLVAIFHNVYLKKHPAGWNPYLYGDVKSTDSPLMAHRACFTYETLAALMTSVGFHSIRQWRPEDYPEICALNDCARSSWHVTCYAEGRK